MADDKYAPKATDTVKQVHQLHRDLIHSQQEENKKEREASHKPKVEPAKPDAPGAHEANPTQPPASAAPQNPDAPQNKPEAPEAAK